HSTRRGPHRGSRVKRAIMILSCLVSLPGSAAAGAASWDGTARVHARDSVLVVLEDSTRVAGVFEGVARVSSEQYRDRYDRWRRTATDGDGLPELGTRVGLASPSMTIPGKAIFCGFSQAGIEVREHDDSPIQTVPFDDFSSLAVPGGKRFSSRKL